MGGRNFDAVTSVELEGTLCSHTYNIITYTLISLCFHQTLSVLEQIEADYIQYEWKVLANMFDLFISSLGINT